MSITRSLARAGCAAAVLTLVPAVVANADHPGRGEPQLTGRAVLPADTVSDGAAAGAFYTGPTNGITFPRPAQPVIGFSGVVEGRRRGEYLAMPDNGFGNKLNSPDFLIRAYYVSPDFKTARRGSGEVEVRDYVSFRDPGGLIGFPIVNEGTADRLLTGADIDPESIQRDHHGDLWIGDEFGPWILHFDAEGRLKEPPISLPDGLRSPANPFLAGTPATVNGSRGVEAMAITPNGKRLVVVLEGAVPGDDPFSRRIYVYDIRSKSYTRAADYRVDVSDKFVADAQALDDHRFLVIERDGLVAAVRTVYAVDLDDVGPDGAVSKHAVLDLAAIPDPDGISLPAVHDGDVGIGDPFRVACESIESLHVESGNELMLTCDNNLPNSGRNPTRADDTEMIVVKVPGLGKKHGR